MTNRLEKALEKAETTRRELIRELKSAEGTPKQGSQWWLDRMDALNATWARIRHLERSIDAIETAVMA